MQLSEFFTDVERQQGRFLFTSYGKGALLGFEGDKLFQRLSYNLAYNYGIIFFRVSVLNPLVRLRCLTPHLSYVYTTETRIKKGLADYFRNQFLMHRTEIDEFAALPVRMIKAHEELKEVEYPTKLLKAAEAAAMARAESFFDNKIVKVDFVRNFRESIPEIYSVAIKGVT